MKKANISGNIYYCEAVHSPDDGGYYIEMTNREANRIYQTEVKETETLAWDEVKNGRFSIVDDKEKIMKKCPRCLKQTLENEDVLNSLSRMDSATFICNDCGNEEALLNLGLLYLSDEIIERDSRIKPLTEKE